MPAVCLRHLHHPRSSLPFNLPFNHHLPIHRTSLQWFWQRTSPPPRPAALKVDKGDTTLGTRRSWHSPCGRDPDQAQDSGSKAQKPQDLQLMSTRPQTDPSLSSRPLPREDAPQPCYRPGGTGAPLSACFSSQPHPYMGSVQEYQHRRTFRATWPTSEGSTDLLGSPLTTGELGLHMCTTALSFYVGSEDSNSGPHTCVESTLPTEL